MDRVLLHVKRFRQNPAECSIAAASSIANFFNSEINYEEVRKLIPTRVRKQGMHTSQQARLLNKLGFKSVTIVTADLDLVDFSWAGFSKKRLISKMKKLRTHYKRIKNDELSKYVDGVVQWLEDPNYNNNIIIDHEFKKYITRRLRKGVPVGASVNWTSLFKFRKWDRKKKNEDIIGIGEDHSIVVRGYDEQGVYIVDSHHMNYRGKRSKYKKGYYKLPWDKFLVNMPSGGDLILL